jgi:hypothetical protein
VFPFLRPAAQAPEDRAREHLDRAVAVLRRYQRAGAAVLPVEDMLEMLGAGPETGPSPEVPARDPQADPLTGCRSPLPR